MFAKLIIVALAITVSSCAIQPHRDSVYWKKSEVIGLTIALDNPNKEEWYSFNGDGSVSATIGEKNGWIAAPLYFWKIRKGKIVISDETKKVIQTLSLISISNNGFTIEDHSGNIVFFKKIQA